VDPHCCCAELAFDAPVEVRFEGRQHDPVSYYWTGHFSLDEVEKIDGLMD